MTIRKAGKWFAVLDDKESELCRFEKLYDASIVFLLLNGGKLHDAERLRAMMLIDGRNNGGSERVST